MDAKIFDGGNFFAPFDSTDFSDQGGVIAAQIIVINKY